jgi:enoyl-CoA hydratase/carnithine racemase
MGGKVRFETDGAVARVTIDRPEKRNCLDIELLDEWLDALADIDGDEAVKVLTLRGAGGNLSAGADLSLFLDAVERGDRDTIDEFIEKIHRVTAGLEALEVPVLGVAEGYAVAGGLEILLACDLRLATVDATLGDQHANYGLVAGGGGTQRLVREIDAAQARELLYTGRLLDGTEAEDWGLVNRAVPADDLATTVEEFERRLADRSRDAAALTKYLVRHGTETDKERGLALERRSVVEYYFSEDAREGFRAFDEGREPDF